MTTQPQQPPPPLSVCTDGAGRPVTDPAVIAAISMMGEFDRIEEQLVQLRREMRDLAKSNAGAEIRSAGVESAFKNLLSYLKFARPFAQCPYFPNCAQSCKCCHGRKWVTAGVWLVIPPEDK